MTGRTAGQGQGHEHRSSADTVDAVSVAEAWLAEDPDPDTRAELQALLEAGDMAGLTDRFGASLEFGTAGLRGALGAGPNRMNRVVVIRAAAGLDLAAQGAQSGRVEVGEVDEGGADDGRGRREVDVVADQHRLTRGVRRSQAAAAVGQHDDASPSCDRRTDPVHDGGDPAALVEVGAAEEHQGPSLAHDHGPEGAGMARDGRGVEAGQLGDRVLGRGLAEHLGGRHPAGAHHQCHVVGLDPGQLAEPRGGVLGDGVRVGSRVAHGATLARRRRQPCCRT